MVRGRDWDVTRELTDLKCAYDGNKVKEKDSKVFKVKALNVLCTLIDFSYLG